jgi:hypothetical protein
MDHLLTEQQLEVKQYEFGEISPTVAEQPTGVNSL